MSFIRIEFPVDSWAEQVRAENERLTAADDDDDYQCPHEPQHDTHRCAAGMNRFDCNAYCTEGDD